MSNRKPIQIVKVRPADLREIMDIQAVSGLSPWSHRDYMDELMRTDSILLKAATGDRSCDGFIVGRKVPGADEERDAEIYNIGVRPEARRSGIGTALIKEFLAICRRDRAKHVWLDVRRSNESAQLFYRRFGFTEASIRPRFYNDPEDDGIVMRLSISEYFLSI